VLTCLPDLFQCKFGKANQNYLAMLLVRNLLVALLCALPVILLFDGLIVQGIIAGVVAVAVAVTAVVLRPGETEFFLTIARPLVLLAIVPALWIVLQIIPLGIFAHPIWASAQAALHQPILGHITIDPAVSLIALGQYLSLTAIACVTAALAVDRRRAEWTLFALGIAVTLVSLMVIAHKLFLGAWLTGERETAAIDCTSLGTIIAAAACIRAVERYETQGAWRQSESTAPRAILAAFAALLICAEAFGLSANRELLFATGCGLLTLAYVLVIRRLGLRLLGTTIMVVPAIWIAIVLVLARPTPHDLSLTLAFASQSSPRVMALSQRMLDDTPVAGTGAGTFAVLAPTYREIDDPPSASPVPTAAGALAIELGKPMLWLIIAATIALILVLLRASLLRGRDSFYSAMAGSSLLALLLICLTNAGLLATAPALLIAATLGLGLAQSKSRKATQP